MGKFTVTHEINCNVDTFWSRFFDKDLNSKLYKDTLGFPIFEIIDQQESDTQISRKVKAKPKQDLPAPVTKIFGSDFQYLEESTLDKANKIWRWKQIPSSLADKIRIEGKIRTEPIGDNKIRLIRDIEIEAKVFGIGGLIESSFEKKLREEADISASFFNKNL